MLQNQSTFVHFDDYPGFQQIPGMPILLQQSVGINKTKNYKCMFIQRNIDPTFESRNLSNRVVELVI